MKKTTILLIVLAVLVMGARPKKLRRADIETRLKFMEKRLVDLNDRVSYLESMCDCHRLRN